MFTKYANVKLPENYSGSRFKRPSIDTEMKTHRAQDISNVPRSVKTSVSPFFQSSQIQEETTAQSNSTEVDTQQALPELDAMLTEEARVEDEETIHTPPEKTQEDSNSTALATSSIKELTRALEKIKSDDLLLLSLILLFAKDGGEGSMDALVILALLLLYH